MAQVDDKSYRERVYEIVRKVPSGRVMTYGQIAEILGEGYTPRTVGYVMHGADTENVPWQRVINSQGACSTGRMTMPVRTAESKPLAVNTTRYTAGGNDNRYWPSALVVVEVATLDVPTA